MGMIGYFAEIDSEKINQLLESTKKPLMDNIHDTLSGLRRLDIDKRWRSVSRHTCGGWWVPWLLVRQSAFTTTCAWR